MTSSSKSLAAFVRAKRQAARLTQPELADRAGVGLRFIRELEAGKATLRLDKVEEVLRLFGHSLTPTRTLPEDLDDDK